MHSVRFKYCFEFKNDYYFLKAVLFGIIVESSESMISSHSFRFSLHLVF